MGVSDCVLETEELFVDVKDVDAVLDAESLAVVVAVEAAVAVPDELTVADSVVESVLEAVEDGVPDTVEVRVVDADVTSHPKKLPSTWELIMRLSVSEKRTAAASVSSWSSALRSRVPTLCAGRHPSWCSPPGKVDPKTVTSCVIAMSAKAESAQSGFWN